MDDGELWERAATGAFAFSGRVQRKRQDERLVPVAQVASLALGELSSDCQSEPGAASPVQRDEPFEGPFLGSGREAGSVVEHLDSEQRLRQVLEAVRTLPKAQRQVVELCLLGDLSITDAAAVLEVAEVTVRSHISRARAQLRALLKETK